MTNDSLCKYYRDLGRRGGTVRSRLFHTAQLGGLRYLVSRPQIPSSRQFSGYPAVFHQPRKYLHVFKYKNREQRKSQLSRKPHKQAFLLRTVSQMPVPIWAMRFGRNTPWASPPELSGAPPALWVSGFNGVTVLRRVTFFGHDLRASRF